MDEWMHLSSAEATYRQQEQRAMRHAARIPLTADPGHRVRVALANVLVNLAARLDPTPVALRRERDAPLAAQA